MPTPARLNSCWCADFRRCICKLFWLRTQQRFSDRRVSIRTGLYGNVAGTLESLRTADAEGIALVLEWSDLDPRLGYREAGAWGPAAVAAIEPAVQKMLDRIAAAVEGVDAGFALAVSLPTLPLPPLFHTPGWQASAVETTWNAACSNLPRA